MGLAAAASVCFVFVIIALASTYIYYRNNRDLPDVVVAALGLGFKRNEKDYNCPAGHYYNEGFCYRDCPLGYFAKGSTCYPSTCPPDTIDKGDYCEPVSKKKAWVVNDKKTCGDGKFASGGMCYDNCPSPLTAVGTKCEQLCPQEYTDAGDTCTKPEKDATNPTDMICNDTEYADGDKCYPKCRAGYVPDGASCVQGPKACPANTIGTKGICVRDLYDRGVGKIPTTCASGETNVLSGCIKNCPSGWTDIGVSCTKPGTYDRGAGFGS